MVYIRTRERDRITCEKPEKEPQIPVLISRAEAARLLGVRTDTLAAWVCRGKVDLPYVKIGGKVRYKITDINDFIKRNTVEKV